MDDFFYEKRNRNDSFFKNDSFFDDTFFPFSRRPAFDSPFSIINNVHREMDEMITNAFGSFSYNPRLPNQPHYPAIEHPSSLLNKDQDLDKQVQQYGLNGLFDDNYLSEWDFVKQLENIDRAYPKSVIENNPNAHFYGRSHFYNYRSDGNKVEERKLVQDSLGRRLESVQKKLGDKVWAKTIKRNEKGEIDENERMLNMDEADKDKFMMDWRNNSFAEKINTAQPQLTDQKLVDQAVIPKAKPLTLPSLEQKSNNWYDKLKFWK